MSRRYPLAAALALFLVLGFASACVAEGTEIASMSHSLDEAGTSIVVEAEVTGDAEDVYLEYYVCTDGICGLVQKADMEESGSGGNYTATAGPFEPDEHVTISVVVYDSQGEEYRTDEVEVVVTGEDIDDTETPGFGALLAVLALASAFVLARYAKVKA